MIAMTYYKTASTEHIEALDDLIVPLSVHWFPDTYDRVKMGITYPPHKLGDKVLDPDVEVLCMSAAPPLPDGSPGPRVFIVNGFTLTDSKEKGEENLTLFRGIRNSVSGECSNSPNRSRHRILTERKDFAGSDARPRWEARCWPGLRSSRRARRPVWADESRRDRR